MLGARERQIKNLVIEALGGPESYRRARLQRDEIDDDYVRMETRRSAVVFRRLIIFTVLYAAIVASAVVVSIWLTGRYDAVLWVLVGTFNAASAGVYYARHMKRRLALSILEVIRIEDEGPV